MVQAGLFKLVHTGSSSVSVTGYKTTTVNDELSDFEDDDDDVRKLTELPLCLCSLASPVSLFPGFPCAVLCSSLSSAPHDPGPCAVLFALLCRT